MITTIAKDISKCDTSNFEENKVSLWLIIHVPESYLPFRKRRTFWV